MVEFVKNRDQFFAQREIEEAWDEKIDDIEDFMVPVGHVRHGAGKNPPCPLDFPGAGTTREAERVYLRIRPVNTAASG